MKAWWDPISACCGDYELPDTSAVTTSLWVAGFMLEVVDMSCSTHGNMSSLVFPPNSCMLRYMAHMQWNLCVCLCVR